ncbi:MULTISPECIES: curli assembly chaperone CsgC [Citrobacter]|uniref:curli assembly chaperone CsgC n=1 Tax=Citrobacter TaxID=544 RepID=UPI001078D453|nr:MULTISPECIES: curli assembly chaperone CsgC [unclassified Citrobacter]EKU7608371.1 curli assembly protein CsgC [Citrobacter freundii]MBJ3557071.1 curli assembly protein CsgC [Salmonella enterica subsp. enterica serovar Derby]MBJ4955572.1 curli assembly protein CsgC [Salmonella enterica subsp. enterica serovar Goldcoast]MBA7966843.1 curli assembly protein CsgC [Citrobacter sp. RHBSTW-00671]MDA8500431.1 curli assembly protein CsgC [Citrobacter sp. Igbk 17]
MHTLLLIAALSNQITFNTTQQGEMYTIIPQVTLSQPCVCQVQVLAIRKGSGGQSQTQQKTSLSIPANRPIELTKLSFNISPEDTVNIVVTVSDGQSLHLSQQWPDSSSRS